MGKFEQDFSEPQLFTEGMIVISALQYSRKEAAKEINDYYGKNSYPQCRARDLRADRIRYGFTPGNVDVDKKTCWYTGASGKGSKPVWVYERIAVCG